MVRVIQRSPYEIRDVRKGRNVARFSIASLLPPSYIFLWATTSEGSSAVYIRAATLGVVAGMRSMLPFALLNWTKDHEQEVSDEITLQRVLNSPGVQFLASSAAIGELLGDKFPMIPDRTKSGPFMGRLMIGAFAGMTLCRRYHQSPLVGAALGAAGAGAGTLLGYYSRVVLGQTMGVSDTVSGLAEDVVALGLGLFAVQKR
jgi:uncharacterized membrane protein